MKKKTNKNIIFILIFLLVIMGGGIVSLNYCKFKNNYPDVNKNFLNLYYIEKNLCYTILNITKHNKYDLVIIGGSAMNQITASNNLKGYKTAKLTLPYIQIYEYVSLLNYYLKLHPETKNIIISLEFPSFAECTKEYTIPTSSKSNTITDFIKLYYSIDSTKKSLSSIYNDIVSFYKKKFSNKSQVENQTEEQHENQFAYNKHVRYLYKNTCEKDGLKDFKKLHDIINEHHLNAYYVMPPANALFLADLYIQNHYNDLEYMKKEIANIVPFYDMAFINHYTTKDIGYLFYDCMHPQPLFLGEKFVQTVLYNNLDDNFAVIINKNNADKILKEQKNNLIKYMKDNEQEVNEYIYENPAEDKFKCDYVSLNKMPKEEAYLYQQNK